MTSIWNSNFFRTILGILAMLIIPALSFLGCTQLPGTTTVDCSASWIDPKWASAVSFVLGIIVYGIKMFAGTGTVAENMTAPVVPVVPPEQAKPGVVTPAQVKTGK